MLPLEWFPSRSRRGGRGRGEREWSPITVPASFLLILLSIAFDIVIF